MTDTIIKIDLSKSAYDNDQVHNRWHPDIPMVATVKPGDDFIVERYDWTGGQIENNDDASDVRDVDLSQVHFLSEQSLEFGERDMPQDTACQYVSPACILVSITLELG